MNKDRKKLLGSRLRAARGDMRLSQAFVAEMLCVTRQSVSAWETGASCPTAVQLAELATLYCTCAHALLFGEPYEAVQLEILAPMRLP